MKYDSPSLKKITQRFPLQTPLQYPKSELNHWLKKHAHLIYNLIPNRLHKEIKMPFVQNVWCETGLSQNFQFIDLWCNNAMIFIVLIGQRADATFWMNLVSYYSLYQHKMFCKFITKALQQNERNRGLRNLFDGYQRKVLCNIFLIISINHSSVEVCYMQIHRMDKHSSFVFARHCRNCFSRRINALVPRNPAIKTANIHGLKTMTFHRVAEIAYFWLPVTEIIQFFHVM